MKIEKEKFDKFVNEILKMITAECEQIKDNIDNNNDGFVDTKECKIILKSVIKGFKKGIRLIK